MNKTVNVLGTEYRIEVCKIDDDKQLKENRWSGVCCSNEPVIVIAGRNDTKYFEFRSEHAKKDDFNETLRHEIVHAFLNQCGLKESANDSWARNEEMVDWIAIQFPKMMKAFEEVGCL